MIRAYDDNGNVIDIVGWKKQIRAEAYQQGRADELDKISKMILLGCDEIKCEECDYRLYSQDVCQQAFTIGVIENYIEEQLKEHTNE